MLLDAGADVASKNKMGETALDKAVEKGHEAVVFLLLRRGAELSPFQDEAERKAGALRRAKCEASGGWAPLRSGDLKWTLGHKLTGLV